MVFNEEVGIDLGTANVLIYVDGKGIVLEEPSVVAVNKDTKEILAVGSEAKRMIGRTPGNIAAVRPLREGVISDYDITEKMLQYFIKKTCGGNRFFKPRLVVCVPSGVTASSRRTGGIPYRGACSRCHRGWHRYYCAGRNYDNRYRRRNY